MPDPQITVAVPVKDRREQMLRCLDALLAQDHPSFEVLVLDNESTDGTGEACLERAARSGVEVRVERVPGTVGRVRNRGGELARGGLLAFTDSDCVPDPGWLRAAASALAADPGLGVVQGRTVPEEPIVQGWPSTISIDAWSGRFESCNLVFRREAFVASDGFDEAWYGWEDTAAGYSVLRGGWRARFVAEAVVRHDVTYPGFWWHVRRRRFHVNGARVVRRYPEVRRELLVARVFLSERDPALLLAVAGLLAAPRRPAALALVLPYVRLRFRSWPGLRPAVQSVVLDGVTVFQLARGSVRHRALVL